MNYSFNMDLMLGNLACPKCRGNLVKKEWGGVFLEECENCGGILLDYSEVRVLADYLIDKGGVPMQPVEYEKMILKPNLTGENKINCPICEKDMRKVNYSYDSNVIIDSCGSCLKVWLEKGELEKMAQYLKSNPIWKGVGEAVYDEECKRIEDEQMAEMAQTTPIMPTTSVMLLGDENTVKIFPWVTWMTILGNVIIFAGMNFVWGVDILDNWLVQMQSGNAMFVVVAALVSMFVHGGWFHVLGNMYYLYIFGDNIEEYLGGLKFGLFYLICGLVSGIIGGAFYFGQGLPVVGASGAIAGLMGAYLVWFPKQRLKIMFGFKIYKISPGWLLVPWILMQILQFIFDKTGGVAYGVHVVGFLTGLGVAVATKRRLVDYR